MRTADTQVLESLLSWLEEGLTGCLCTIVATAGSSPRPVGSLLACNSRGDIAGSLSGGCIEEDFLERIATGDLPGATSQVLEYGVTAQENERLGLPCGGRLRVLVEPIPASDTVVESWRSVLQAMAERRCVRRTVRLDSGVTGFEPVDRYSPLEWDGNTLRHCFGPHYRMLLIGAGQLSHCLAELALAMDYQVVVCDPRENLLRQWDLDGVELVGGMPDDAVRRYADDPMSIVVTLTHDPRIDDMALMEALATRAFYVGALGSARTSAARRKRLEQLDLDAEQVARLHAPVGLPIGSKTPYEIAISILAELTRVRSASVNSPD